MANIPENQFETVVIIGNGFDLNLGLPTSYTDFIKSVPFDKLLKRENNLCIHLKNNYELHNWIDIENELKVYSNNLKDASRDKFHKEYLSLCNSLMDYLNSIDYSIINKGSYSYKIMNKGLNDTQAAVINFNYTDSVNIIAQELNEPITKIINVHGTAKEGKIIFGVEDKASINKDDIFLLKTASPHYKSAKINKILKNAKNIIIIGHSLGETDHHYFSEFFGSLTMEHAAGKEMVIVNHTETGRLQVMKQMRELTIGHLSAFFDYNNYEYVDTCDSPEIQK